MSRPPYSEAQLRCLLDPRSVAVVGASPDPASFAGRTLANLAGYQGGVWRVNPRYREIVGLPCWPSVRALPEPPDLVIVAVGRDRVETVIEDCVAAGAGAAVIYASGYAETGVAADLAAQERLTALAGRSGLRILGPNCIGLVTTAGNGARLTFSATPALDPAGDAAIGIVTQSGALAFALGQAASRGVRISHLLATGNACDVDVADGVHALVADDGCRAIICVAEAVAAPERLLLSAQAAKAAGKPLVVHQGGRTPAGSAAARAHTGRQTGDWRALRAGLLALGAVCLDRFDELLPVAQFLAKVPPPRARGVAVLAVSGGAAILATDALQAQGLPMPQPAADTAAILERHVPAYGSASNPCDVTAQVLNDPGSLAACAEALLADPAIGVLVHPAPWASDQVPGRMQMFSGLAARTGKPVCVVWISQWLDGPGTDAIARDRRLALFHSMETCARTLGAWSDGLTSSADQV